MTAEDLGGQNASVRVCLCYCMCFHNNKLGLYYSRVASTSATLPFSMVNLYVRTHAGIASGLKCTHVCVCVCVCACVCVCVCM